VGFFLMTDIYDQATAREEQERDACIARVRSQTSRLKPVGYCYYCSEPVKSDRRFCDKDCMEDWEHQDKMHRIGGGS